MASDRVELLRRVPIFSTLDERELADVASRMKEYTYGPGEPVATEGETGIGFFVIEDGRARVTVHGEERARLGPGDHFGEVALVSGGERTATVSADTDLRCLRMTSWEFKPLVEANPKIAWKLLQGLARRLVSVEQRTG